jgi:hypothetical protein
MNRYHGARVLAQELGPLAEAGSLNLEQKLREYRFSSDSRVKAHYKEVPPYLRDVVAGVAAHHRSYPGCYTQLVKQLLADIPHELLFLTTNYDDLIEQALTAFDSGLGYQSIDDYAAAGRPAKVVKIHGSTDWFFALAGYDGQTSWREVVHASQLDFDPDQARRALGHVGSAEQLVDLRKALGTAPPGEDARGWLYPCITAPEAGKIPSTSFSCPKSHTEAATDFLEDCERFLIIGSSGLDEDLLSMLVTEREQRVKIHLVGGGDAFQAAIRFSRAVPRFHRLGEQGTVYIEGLRAYLAAGSIRDLLDG